MSEREKSLEERERALEAREKELDEREKQMDAFSRQVHKKKLEWYEHVNLTVGQMNIIVRVVYVLIVLEAAGIFRL